MSYATPQSFRMALERRLRDRSNASGVSLDRLRRRVLLERVLARLLAAQPGLWVLKGGMALEVRLHDEARLTKDIDLGMREVVADAAELHERLIDALATDPDGDGFVLLAASPQRLQEDGGGHVTWRVKVAAELAGRTFGGVKLDVSPREHELDATDQVTLPNSLDFAGVPAQVVEIVDVHRHAAEKLHAMFRDYGDRENSRVRDLIDLVMLVEHDLLASTAVASAVRQVWVEREHTTPPTAASPLPETWPDRYEQLAVEYELEASTFPAAVDVVDRLWRQISPNKEA